MKVQKKRIARINCTYHTIKKALTCHFFIDLEEMPALASVCYDFISLDFKKVTIPILKDKHSSLSHVWTYYADSETLKAYINEKEDLIYEVRKASETTSDEEFINIAFYYENGEYFSKKVSLSTFQSLEVLNQTLSSLVPEEESLPEWFRIENKDKKR